jgi:hypothetical protein
MTTQTQQAQREIHLAAAEKLLATCHDGYPQVTTDTLRRALVHATLAVAYAKAAE